MKILPFVPSKAFVILQVSQASGYFIHFFFFFGERDQKVFCECEYYFLFWKKQNILFKFSQNIFHSDYIFQRGSSRCYVILVLFFKDQTVRCMGVKIVLIILLFGKYWSKHPNACGQFLKCLQHTEQPFTQHYRHVWVLFQVILQDNTDFQV